MPDLGKPSQSDEDAHNAVDMVTCPKCHAQIAQKMIATHLLLQCASRKESSNETARTGLLAEYAEEKEREADQRAIYMLTPRFRKEVADMGGPVSSWPVCPQCSEYVRVDLMRDHQCQTQPLYTQFAAYLGVTNGTVAEDIERLLADRPGSTARDLAYMMSDEYHRSVDTSIINSALYSFRNDRFRRVPEGDNFDERKSPRWYCLRNISR